MNKDVPHRWHKWVSVDEASTRRTSPPTQFPDLLPHGPYCVRFKRDWGVYQRGDVVRVPSYLAAAMFARRLVIPAE